MTDFGDTSWPVARKPHRCEWCGEVIAVGEKHARYVGKWEGDFQNWRMHSDCLEYADENDALQDGFAPYEHERPALAAQEKA